MKIKVLCEGQTEEGLRILLEKAVAVPGCGIHIKTYEGVGALLRGLDDAVESELRSGARVVFCVVDYHHYPLPQITRNLPPKVLQELFRTRSQFKKRYNKFKDGVDLLEKVDSQKVYAKCPAFKQLVDDLRNCCRQ